ncbi:hypothetical protein [Acidianus brierleyi]|uniref:Uncharacterized protein n=1 Tax=Acidianus brierleyi TaxID=41673 RepID=A0A2U9IFK4_9CREN|nr:hypothetical protein [Acidianus brierleyi]AWR94724.1 hypothetical protein DFR85_09075 [Acidianus brierleyi]
MANIDSLLANRGGSTLIGLLMFSSSIYLLYTIHFSISDLFGMVMNFDPYFFYPIGLILGLERLIYGISGNKKFYYMLMGQGDMTPYIIQGIFIFGIVIGVYIAAYSLSLTTTLDKLAEIGEGVSYVLFAISLLKMP